MIKLGKVCPILLREVQGRIKNFQEINQKILRKNNLDIEDFPQKKKMQEQVAISDFAKFPGLYKNLLEKLDTVINEIKQLPLT